ncbi:hypothetical protein [Roseimaritima sediminicola]|uniref:hypothetical protein n=1 Tax=Roseimaritima sediminicola TaxID=2662066 RepID=UPI001298461A|nr:hypothetical protein [Roseimaritima sediminicola]
MQLDSPLTDDETFFTHRLLFETLNYNELAEKVAEPQFRNLGLTNGAIENFVRVLQICEDTILRKIHLGDVPSRAVSCPWKHPTEFLDRVLDLQVWLSENGGTPCDVEPFVTIRQSGPS